MKRVIKFRAWDKRNNIIIPFTDNWICEEYSSICWSPPDGKWSGIGNLPGSYGNLLDGQPINEMYELMQFTGLLDKNGKEIYEGDILKGAGIVAWNDVEVRWSCIDIEWNDKREWHDMLYLTTPLEVIGNIYENKDLL